MLLDNASCRKTLRMQARNHLLEFTSQEALPAPVGSLRVKKRFTVIWQAQCPQEREWIEEIFGPYVKDYVYDGSHQLVADDCILCEAYINNGNTTYYQQFRGKNAFLVHFLDENYEGPYEVYKNFKAVLRQFWSSVFNRTYVKPLPLGYNVGLSMRDVKPALSRKYIWSFAGQINKSSRLDAVRELTNVVPNYIYPTDRLRGFLSLGNSPARPLSADRYREILSDSIFAPSPMGNSNLECFRVYEALEQGAIPIVERRSTLDYYKALLGNNHPLPTVKSWREARSLIASLIKKPAKIEDLQQTCVSWWSEYKVALSNEIGEFLEGRLDDNSFEDRTFFAPRAQSRWWRLVELTRHHNVRAMSRRICLQTRRLSTTGKLRIAFRP